MVYRCFDYSASYPRCSLEYSRQRGKVLFSQSFTYQHIQVLRGRCSIGQGIPISCAVSIEMRMFNSPWCEALTARAAPPVEVDAAAPEGKSATVPVEPDKIPHPTRKFIELYSQA